MQETNYSLEVFRPEHLWELQVELPVQDLRGIARLYSAHPGFTGRYRGRVIGCAGIVVTWPGLGEGWLIPGPDIHAHGQFLHRTVTRMLFPLIETLGLRRLQACVEQANAPALRWALRLGFIPESTMPLFGPQGQTYMKLVILSS